MIGVPVDGNAIIGSVTEYSAPGRAEVGNQSFLEECRIGPTVEDRGVAGPIFASDTAVGPLGQLATSKTYQLQELCNSNKYEAIHSVDSEIVDKSTGGDVLPSLRALQILAVAVEEACLAGRQLQNQELLQLEECRRICVHLTSPCEESSLRLRGLGQRFLSACAVEGAAAIGPLPEAWLRRLACEMIALGLGKSWFETGSEEAAVLAAHWALAGRACYLVGAIDESLSCFEAASLPWQFCRAQSGFSTRKAVIGAKLERLAEAALQADLWATEAHFRRAAHKEALLLLAQVRDALSTLPNIRKTMVDPLVKVCYDHATALRRSHCLMQASRADNAEFDPQRAAHALEAAVELLLLALAAASLGDCPNARIRLLRQLAICHSEAGNGRLALACAREAATLSANSKATREAEASLRLLLRLLLEPSRKASSLSLDAGVAIAANEEAGGVALGEAEMEEVRAVVLSLIRLHCISASACLDLCDDVLMTYGLPTDCVSGCLAELCVRLGASSDASGRAEALRFRLSLATPVAAELIGNASIEVRHLGLLREIHDAVVAVEPLALDPKNAAQLQEVAAESISILARKAQEEGRLEVAARWYQRVGLFLSSSGAAADCLAASGACLWRAGHKEEARRCAEEALAKDEDHVQAMLLVLLAANESRGDAQTKGDTELVQSLLQRLQAQPAFHPAVAAMLAQALLHHPDEDVTLLALEVFARRLLRQDDDMSTNNLAVADYGVKRDLCVEGLCVVRELVERSSGGQRSDAELTQYLVLAAEYVAQPECQRLLALQVSEGSGDEHRGCVISEVARIVDSAWARGQALGQRSRWDDCTLVLDALLSILDLLDSVEVFEVLEKRVWCLMLITNALAQCAKTAGSERGAEHCQRALRCAASAHTLCKRMAVAPLSSCDLGCEPPREMRRLFVALVLLEFEVRCRAGDAEAQLKQFVEEASKQDVVGLAGLLAMSKIASVGGRRSTAMLCLQMYLRLSIGAFGAAAYIKSAAVYRELIALHESRNASFAVYEGILNLLTGHSALDGGQKPLVASPASYEGAEDELGWLVATAWNNGVHFCHFQQHRWAERWLRVGLSLAGLCPERYPQERMRNLYIECLPLCCD